MLFIPNTDIKELVNYNIEDPFEGLNKINNSSSKLVIEKNNL
jgi:hypothetical protein